ncbi:hypothetical protein GGS23DRAFT_620694 [Durotheca rogersii]|uniref:uncharacterized protein n=1 Tax=Durotheca rogersii TaxID=419775 RepID=UPI00221FF770|nr:uncharacterized protein GGS23DRAFT_620694 [Durotheca rogersii]KAI5863862.1 hypothetical protein GGS23DRAFT_620694 [Durotheca rogersii]
MKELKRFDLLRKTLSRNSDDKHLMESLTRSLLAWHRSKENPNASTINRYSERIRELENRDETQPEVAEYELEKDISAPIIHFGNCKGEDVQDPQVWNSFPNQKTSIRGLLGHRDSPDKSSNLLRRDQSSNRVRYFHIPSNNIDWAERAIGKYFDEKPPDFDATHRELFREKKTRAYMVLRSPYWRGMMHGRQEHSPPHARHMKSLCEMVSSNPSEIDNFPNNMVLFMPYLHWDTSRKQEQFATEMENITKKRRDEYRQNSGQQSLSDTCQANEKNIKIDPKRLFKIRKPKNSGPEAKEKMMNKVMRKWPNIPLFVDDNGRVKIQNPLGQLLLDAARLYEGMSNYRDKMLLRSYLGPGQIRTVFDLALIIIDECSNTFFERTDTLDRQPQVLDIFSHAIGHIMHNQTLAFEKLWHWTDDARKIYQTKTKGDISELYVPLLDINPEGKLEQEIKDIIEELDIMIYITKIYKRILSQFILNAESVLDPEGEFSPDEKRSKTGRSLRVKFRNRESEPRGAQQQGGEAEPGSKENKQKDYDWFKINADERLKIVGGRIEELEELRTSAVNTTDSVKDLLELKQQQASVVQAWQAVKQSDESIKQGRSIMMFTLVTIIFLPLSFMSSVFGMNNKQVTSETWSIGEEFTYMFSISAAVIIVSLLLAFGGWIRALFYYAWKTAGTRVLVRLGAYAFWLEYDVRAAVDRLTHDVREDRVERRAEAQRLFVQAIRAEAERPRARDPPAAAGAAIDSDATSDTATQNGLRWPETWVSCWGRRRNESKLVGEV